MSAATAITLTAQAAAGPLNTASQNFTAALSPVNGTATATIVTPASTIAGTFSPTTVTLSTMVQNAVFTFTPSAQGTASISETNNNALSDATPLSYYIFGPTAATNSLAGNYITPTTNRTLTLVPNTWFPVLVTISECPAQITAGNFIVYSGLNSSTTFLNKSGLIVDPGTVQSDGSYTAKILFNLVEADTTTFIPGNTYPLGVQATTVPTHTISVATQCAIVVDPIA